METFKLVTPTKEDEEKAFDFVNEFRHYDSYIEGTGGLTRYMNDYDGWLQKLEEDRVRETTDKQVPSETYFLVRETDNRIVGILNFRLELNDKFRRFGGNIGYSIRPTERRKGYNKINLYLAFLEAQKRGIDKLMLDCSSDNIGSYKTLQALGGILTKEETDPYDGETRREYWFNVDECIEKYRETYEPYISTEKTRKK